MPTIALLTLALSAAVVEAGDWPAYRADAARSGYSADPLPADLELVWIHRAPTPTPAWPQAMRVAYDFAPQPIIVGGLVVFVSSADDRVVALDAASGQVRWEFVTGGPVRFAPAAWRDRLFVASDDGWLVALSLEDGRLLWKHRGGPDARMCLGNGRLISRWPARGGPVVWDDTVYYTAGIWPSEGVHVHALDAATGQARWSNDRSGGLYMPQPHGGADAASGVAPQGYLLATGERLFVPTGRAVPAVFRREDGELEHYRLQENGAMGGARALLADRFVINGGCFLDAATGSLAARGGRGVFSVLPDGILQFTGSTLLGYRWAELESHGRKGQPVRYRGLQKFCELQLDEESDQVHRAAQAAASLPGLTNLFQTRVLFREVDDTIPRQTGLERVLAQSRPDVQRLGADVAPFQAAAYERTHEVIAAAADAVCGSSRRVSVVDLATQQVRWSHAVDGDAVGLAAANGWLLVATTAGTLYAFGEPQTGRETDGPAEHIAAEPQPSDAPPADGWWAEAAEEILRQTGVTAGLCLDLGCGDGQLALELARRSDLQVIGVEDDPDKVQRARRRLAAAGVHGARAAVHQGNPLDPGFPQYCADLIVSSRRLAEPAAKWNQAEFRRLQRPFGGVVCWGSPGNLQIERRGALEGAGSWTHQNSDAANTLCSADRLVRGPLEVAWYRDGVLEIPDRHAQGPAPLFNRGYLVVAGVHGVCALDAYNGRTHWIYPIPGLLADWDGVHHDVGVGDTGSNFCLSDDAVFVRTDDRCLKIDLTTGALAAEFRTPVDADAEDRDWGYIAYADGVLFGSVLNRAHTVSPRYADVRLRTESVLLFAMDPDTGEVLWQYRPTHSIRNNTIAIAAGWLYLIDRPLAPADRITEPKPNGRHRPRLQPGEHSGGTLLALAARSGQEHWRTDDDVFGTQLAVSPRHGVLLMYYQGVKHKFFRLPSEIGGRMAAWSLDSGTRLWDRQADHTTRPIINGDMIYAEGGAWKLMTGESVPWEFERSYGCGQITASRHVMLFRSATLGYLDLSRNAGLENYGGIRPSCWFNAIPAGGQVLVPDGSAKCACSYQMRAWLALQPKLP